MPVESCQHLFGHMQRSIARAEVDTGLGVAVKIGTAGDQHARFSC